MPLGIGRAEEAQLPADDLREEAIGLEPVLGGFREAGELDPVHAHDAGPVQLHPLGQPHDGLALQNEGMDLRRRELRRVVRQRGRDPGGRDPAADDALAVIGLQPVDAGFVLGELLPDRQQQARHDVQRGFRELRHLGQFRGPGGGEGRAVGLEPVGVLHDLGRNRAGLGRADQPQARLDGAVVQHQAGGGHLHGGPARAAVDQKPCLRVVEPVERIRERGRRVAPLFRDGQKLGFGAGAGMGVDHPSIRDAEALGAQRLEPEVIDPGGDGALDPLVEQVPRRPRRARPACRSSAPAGD